MTTEEIDFTKEDQGKYRHPDEIGGIPYAELEERFEAALAANVRTLSRIKQHMGLERSVDITQLLDGMQMDEKISKHSNGTLTAYFRFDQRPIRFWTNGDGTIETVFDEAFIPSSREKSKPAPGESSWRQYDTVVDQRRSSERGGRGPIELDPDQVRGLMAKHGKRALVAKELGIGGSTLEMKISQQAKIKQAIDDGKAEWLENHPPEKPKELPPAKPSPPDESVEASEISEPVTEPVVSQRRPGKPVVVVDREKLRLAMEELGKRDLVAAKLGIGVRTLWRKLDEDPELLKVYTTAKATFAKNNPGRSRRSKAHISTAAFRDYAAAGRTFSEMAKDFGVSATTITYRMKNPQNREAWDEGVKLRTAQEKPVEEPLPPGAAVEPPEPPAKLPEVREPETHGEAAESKELIAPEPSVNNVEKIADAEPIEPSRPPSRIGMEITVADRPTVKTVPVAGAMLQIGFKGDIFAMSRRDRDLLNDLIDRIQRHEEEICEG